MPRTTIPLYLVTFNCARLPHSTTTLSAHLLSGLPASSPGDPSQPELIVLSLQELAPLAASFLGGDHLTSYFTPFSTAVRLATRKAFDEDYALAAYRNIGLTGIMVFARHVGRVKFVEHGEVGTGVWEMGNKGGVGVRVGYEGVGGVVEMNFISMHLAAHEWNVESRNKDWESIVRGMVFEPSSPLDESSGKTGIYHPTSHLFVMGDLNYRTSDIRPQAFEYLVYPRVTDNPLSNTHFLNLLVQDQLTAQCTQGNTLQGLVEEKITFPPTYKLKPSRGKEREGKEESWNWSKTRWPSWTDRIFYLPLPPRAEVETKKITVHNYTSIPGIISSDHRPVVLYLSIPAQPIPPPSSSSTTGEDIRVNPPFAIDKDWKSRRASARRKEVVVGCLAWLVTTWAGLGVIMAFVVGGYGGLWVLRALVMRGYEV
ncbi:hypothetical protein Q9L58_003629 [Maublancomyces gigas]|uniref:Inositol polyphosphate-related phosphatase domain-containing protein n=1 Tax=Discina gigas TaxID=1032678 RepID=A0ABR3GNC3_9PEZI